MVTTFKKNTRNGLVNTPTGSTKLVAPTYNNPTSSVTRLLATKPKPTTKLVWPQPVASKPVTQPVVTRPIAPAPIVAPVIPAPGSVASITPPRDTFSYAPSAEELALERQRQAFLKANGADASLNVDPEKEYKAKLKLYQGQIDATNAVYNDKLNASRVAGQGRLGSSRAIQGRSGLLGSDFGAAQTDTITGANQEADTAVQNERSVAIESILGLARKDALDAVTAKTAAKKAGADALLKYYSDDVPAQKTARLSKVAKALYDKSIDPSTLTPAELKQLSTDWNVSADDIASSYGDIKATKDAEASDKKLKDAKSQADIDKINADIASGKLVNIGEGNKLFNTETGEVVAYNPKTYAPKGTGESGGGIYGQLDYRTANAVIAQGNQFSGSPVVKKYNELVSAANLINGVDPNTKNPADHQAIVYNFAKALDPESVVREGEYATIKKYSQGLLSKYKGEINQAVKGSGFLSPQAIADIQAATKNRVDSYTPQYTNVRTQTAARINSIAGQDVADTVLLDFEGGYQDPASLGVDQATGDPEFDDYLQSLNSI